MNEDLRTCRPKAEQMTFYHRKDRYVLLAALTEANVEL